MSHDPLHACRAIAETLLRIYHNRMTTTSGGNLSVRGPQGDLWITPSRMDKGSLRPEDVVHVTREGRGEGAHQPSSEYPFHQQIFQSRPDIHAIVHAHPVALSAFAMMGKVPDLSALPLAISVCGRVAVAPYEMPGSEALGRSLATAFARGADCVIMENHGVVVGGSDLPQAFARFETLETCAATYLKALQLSQPRCVEIRQDDLVAWREPAMPAYSEEARPDQVLCEEVCRLIRRGYCRRLFTSTQGSFSARLDARAFLINCYGVDRGHITPRDMAMVRQGQCEKGKIPSRAARLHEAIYQRHRDVRAIITASPAHATAFSLSDTPLDTRTLTESYFFLRDPARIPLEMAISRADDVAGRVSMECPAALIQNEGALVLGKSVLEAFDRLEVLEATAEASLYARLLGKARVIPDDRIDPWVRQFQG